MDKILNMDQLKAESKNGLDCFILLNGGLKSSKHIWYDVESIDDTEVCLTEAELYTKSNIGEAIKKGALIKD